MSLRHDQFLNEIIEPTLDCMGRIIDKRMNTEESKMLLLGTACAESQLTFLKQLGDGPAVGLYQMEPATYADIVKYCQRKGSDFHNKVIYCIYQEMYRSMPHGKQLMYNLRLQTVFARLHYWRVSEPIPKATPAQAKYWKKYYNTEEGAGTLQHYISSFPVFD
jgi:hypothetical protein